MTAVRRSLPVLPLVLGLVAAVALWGICRLALGPASPAARPTAAAATVFTPTVASPATPPADRPEGMAWIPGGEFSMGCADPRGIPHGGPDPMGDARPIHRVRIDGFWMDRTEVTNSQFAAFVKATGYVTVAERKPRQEDFPDAPPENLVAGSVVFTPPPGPVPLDYHQIGRAHV